MHFNSAKSMLASSGVRWIGKLERLLHCASREESSSVYTYCEETQTVSGMEELLKLHFQIKIRKIMQNWGELNVQTVSLSSEFFHSLI